MKTRAGFPADSPPWMPWSLISPVKVTSLGFTAGTKPSLETGNDTETGREMPPLPTWETLFQSFPALRPLSQASSQEGWGWVFFFPADPRKLYHQTLGGEEYRSFINTKTILKRERQIPRDKRPRQGRGHYNKHPYYSTAVPRTL